MHSGDDSSDNDTGPDLPAGVLRSRGGWADANNLEIEHQRERLRAADEDGKKGEGTNAHAAVDLSQFRNEEVGKGYQAKHVVRQREASTAASGVVDMSGGKFTEQQTSAADKKRSRDDSNSRREDLGGRKKQHTDSRLKTYLKSKGMRDFMKEVDKILKQG